MNPLYEQMKTSVFERMSNLAVERGAVNLGQGFPDFGWPEEILDAAANALRDGSNQYPPSRGLMALRDAVATHYNRYQGLSLSADHVCVTSGATEALGAAIFATVQAGDEVILLTPAYDSYAPMVRSAGAIVREVALQPPGWRIDAAALEGAITPKTRAIIFNNPHNPAGRMFEREELETLARIAREHDLIVISDEVWEHVVLSDQPFVPLSSLPGMAERTIKVGSAGKIFLLTGWKVGWMIGSPELAAVVARAHLFINFSTPPNLQSAVAFGLEVGEPWIAAMRPRFTRARDRLVGGLRDAGFDVIGGEATYFVCVDLAASGIAMDDESFALAAVEQAGVAVIPLSAFAADDPPRHLVRLCFAKKDETIDAGIAAMARAKELLG
ncbi:MAG: aminotransferase [Sphingomonas sp.]|nr:aminotransferase [Sphingomonas sp.]